MRVLFITAPAKLHLVTLASSPIAKLADLKGKRVAYNSPGSATEDMVVRIFEAVGLDVKDVTRVPDLSGIGPQFLQSGSADAVFVLGAPNPGLRDLLAGPGGLKIKLIDIGDTADAINKKYGPMYVKGNVAANTYAGQTAAASSLDAWSMFLSGDKLSDAAAYAITKATFEHLPDIIANNPGTHSDWAVKMQGTVPLPAPYHAGALRYFAEKGVKVDG